jgi:hypothetical protein
MLWLTAEVPATAALDDWPFSTCDIRVLVEEGAPDEAGPERSDSIVPAVAGAEATLELLVALGFVAEVVAAAPVAAPSFVARADPVSYAERAFQKASVLLMLTCPSMGRGCPKGTILWWRRHVPCVPEIPGRRHSTRISQPTRFSRNSCA